MSQETSGVDSRFNPAAGGPPVSDEERAAWRDAGFAVAVRTPDRDRWRELVGSGLPLVRDAGFTEIAPGSCTVVADHPALR